MSSALVIRKADIDDILNVVDVHANSFLAAHESLIPQEALKKLDKKKGIERWTERLSGKDFLTYIAQMNRKIVGFITFSYLKSNKEKNLAEILYLYIEPHYWRRGIGKKLILSVLNTLYKSRIKKVYWWVLKRNPKSRAFYEALGAKTDGEERIHEMLGTEIDQVKYYIFVNSRGFLQN